jgi:YVTN family beta-propeller protein
MSNNRKNKNFETFLAAFFAVLILVLSALYTVNAIIVSTTLSVGKDPQGMAYDPESGEMYVANFGSNTVSVINDSTNTVVATIKVGTQPKNIAYDSGKDEVFVTNWGSGTVSVISDRTYSVVATIPVGIHPVGIAYDSAKSEIFVANSGDNTVSVISDTNNSVVATVTTGTNLLNGSSAHGLGDAHPIGVTYDSATNEIYVVNSYPDSSGSGTVSVISDSNNSVLVSIPVGELPHYAAYDSRRGLIFVTNLQDGFVSVISDTTHNVIAQVTLPKPGASGGNTGITYDFKTGEVFVLNRSGSVFVISNSSLPWMNAVRAYNVTLGIGGDCYGIAYNDAKESLFVANAMNNTASILSTSSLQTQTPAPSVPEFSWLMILPLFLSIILVAVLIRRRKLSDSHD